MDNTDNNLPPIKITPLIFIKSLLFNISFFSWAIICSLLLSPLFIVSARASQLSGKPWGLVSLFFARIFCGIKYEIRGRENMKNYPVIYASKHQSAWDTIIFLILFPRVAYVLKKELLRLPLWGWYLWRMKMIAIDRSAGASSIKKLIKESKEAIEEKRPIVIFPEGTRVKPNSVPDYQPGITAMYSSLKVPVVPVALNSGVYWGKNAFFKRSGTIIIEFLPEIPANLNKKEFINRLKNDIELVSGKLIEEAKQTIENATGGKNG
ncbi:MAG: lysophospholipid acyltransferase family protein [Rickettsiales bacterium]